MVIISDSSPLILLSKIERLNLLQELYSKILIPPEVYEETVNKGKKEGYSDAKRIEKAVNQYIEIRKLNKKHLEKSENLKSNHGSGESEAITLAIQENAERILADDIDTRELAERNNIKWRSTLGILLLSLKNQIIHFKEYEKIIEELSEYSWISPNVISKYMREGYKIQNNMGGIENEH